MKRRMAQIRWRSRRHREELGETVKGCPQGLSEAAAHYKPRESHHQDLKGKKSWDAEMGMSQGTKKSFILDLRGKTYLMQVCRAK